MSRRSSTRGDLATVICAWRQFLGELWSALKSVNSPDSRAPSGCIWAKQVARTIRFVLAFLHLKMGTVRRVYSVDGRRIP